MMIRSFGTVAICVACAGSLSGCTLLLNKYTFYDPDGSTEAGTGQMDGGPSDGGIDASFDAGMDAGPPDAGPPDAGPFDAGPPDAGPCLTDPAPQGIGSCTSSLDCIRHCNDGWDVGCVFGAYGDPIDVGRCVYRDCRQVTFRVDYSDRCPSSSNPCPALCDATHGRLVACTPGPPANGRCDYFQLPDAGS